MTYLTNAPKPFWVATFSEWGSNAEVILPSNHGPLNEAKAQLVEAIQNGFLVEETGKVAKIPNFAKPHLATLVQIDV